MINCQYCNKETRNKKYCSRNCSASVTGRVFRKRKLSKPCRLCGIGIRASRAYCSSCWESIESSYKNKTLDEYNNMDSVKNKHPSWKNAHIRCFARSWNKDMKSSPCAKCGYSIHTELAHIKPITSFSGSSRLIDINSRNNLLPLCPNCHWEFDNLPRDEFKKFLPLSN